MQLPLYLVAGLGKTGGSIARYLTRRHKPFVVFDTRQHPDGLDAFKAEFPGVDVFLGDIPDELYSKITEVISSPGVSLEMHVMQKMKALDIPVIGDIECLTREITAPVVAITGTNGKSTVTTLVGEMAKASGLSVAVAGNIGSPVLDLVDDGVHYDLWVLELSSFQLDLTYSLAPAAATILNITPDHLDRHHDLDSYILSKQRIYDEAKVLVYNRDDELTYPFHPECAQHIKSFGLDCPTANDYGLLCIDGVNYMYADSHRLMPVDALRIKGRHNWSNALAAWALASEVGIHRDYIIDVLRHFSGLSHRCEWVRSLNGVEWIDDSKGTNVGAAQSAIAGIGGAMQGKIVLIAGGQGKGADFSGLNAPVMEFVRTVVLIGEDANHIETALNGVVPVLRANSMDEAVQVAKLNAIAGDVILLSPACASFDMFRDYNHRGEVFKQAVEAL